MGKKGAGEKKEKSGAASGGTSEVEREEMALKMAALEDKLLTSNKKIDDLAKEYESAKEALSQQQADTTDIVEFMKHESKKRADEYTALENKYIAFKESKEDEVDRLLHDLTTEKEAAQAARAQFDDYVADSVRLKALEEEHATLQQTSAAAAKAADEQTRQLQAQLDSTTGKLNQTLQQLHILATPKADDPLDHGGSAVPLLLLEAIRTFTSKYLLVEQACYALQSVLSGDRKDDCVTLRKNGVVPLVLGAMRIHEDKAGLQAAACGLLWKVAFTDQHSRKLIIVDGGVQLILHAMQCHLAHPRLQYNACGALRNLLVNDSHAFSVSSQIIGSPRENLPPLSAHPPNTSDKRRAAPKAGGVRAVSSSPRGMVRMGANDSGSSELPPLSARGRGHDRSNHQRELLSPNPPRRDQLPNVTPSAREPVLEQALDLTLRSMSEHADEALVQEYGCGTLWNLMMAHPPMKGHAAEVRGVGLVLQAMRAHPSQAGVQLNASSVLKEFASHPDTLEQMKQGDARDALRQAISNHPNNADLIKIAGETIHTMPTAVIH